MPDPRPNRGGLVLELGLLSLLTCGMPPAGLALGVLACWIGLQDLRGMRDNSVDAAGRDWVEVGFAFGALAFCGSILLTIPLVYIGYAMVTNGLSY